MDGIIDFIDEPNAGRFLYVSMREVRPLDERRIRGQTDDQTIGRTSMNAVGQPDARGQAGKQASVDAYKLNSNQLARVIGNII